MYVYRCRDSLESIFTAIYRVYEDRRSREEVLLSLDDEPMLFAEEIIVEADECRCGKVIRTLKNRFGTDNYEDICLTLASPDPEKAQAVYGTIAMGLSNQCDRGHLFDALADADVNKAFKLARNASRENCHLRGFTRFEELEKGIMYARIGPKNNLLTFLMPHFADRFPEENFVLHDVGRDLFGIHPAVRQDSGNSGDNLPASNLSGAYQESEAGSGAWYLLKGADLSAADFQVSGEEQKYQVLFKEFCKSIAIGERRNLELQRGMLPLHFREYMTEFQ